MESVLPSKEGAKSACPSQVVLSDRAKQRLTHTLARVKFYHFTVFGFNSGQRTNEVAMGNNCRGMDTFALEKIDEPVRP